MSDRAVPVVVGLTQINIGFSGQFYLPLSVGFLQAYVESAAVDPARYTFLPPLYKRLHVDESTRRMKTADVAGFSVYVWNVEISLAIAERLKAARPERLIIFGGPHVPDNAEDFLLANPFVDVAVHGEGEYTFLQLIESFPSNNWTKLPGISFIDRDGIFQQNQKRTRSRDLSGIPSPYQTGIFDDLIAANPDEKWLAMWETNRGCPFSCTYCDWGSAVAAKVNAFEFEQVKGDLEWFAEHRVEFVFCCDANFGLLPRDVELAHAASAIRARTGYPKALSVQSTKNATDRAFETQKILAEAGLGKGATISLQTTSPVALEKVKRKNISVDSFSELQRRFSAEGMNTYTDFIIGLPGETLDSFCDGVANVIEKGQHNRIQFNNCSVLPNSEMGNPDYIAENRLKLVNSAIVNLHGSLDDCGDGIQESQRMVVGTADLSADDWRAVKSYAWIISLFHFDKLLQIPLLLLHFEAGLPFRRLVEAFLNLDAACYPVLGEIRGFFDAEARSLQSGGPELVFSEEWLGVYWPADEHTFIRLSRDGKLDAFYAEAGVLLGELIDDLELVEMLGDALTLNRVMIKQPGQSDDIEVELKFDMLAYYRAALGGRPPRPKRQSVRCRIERSREVWSDWPSWMQEVVWYGHKSGAYLYGNVTMDTALAGHY